MTYSRLRKKNIFFEKQWNRKFLKLLPFFVTQMSKIERHVYDLKKKKNPSFILEGETNLLDSKHDLLFLLSNKSIHRNRHLYTNLICIPFHYSWKFRRKKEKYAFYSHGIYFRRSQYLINFKSEFIKNVLRTHYHLQIRKFASSII